MSNPTFEISPSVKGLITERDLLTSHGTISFWLNSSLFGKITGVIFKLDSDEYFFELGFTATDYYLRRNDFQINYPLNTVNQNESVLLFAFWRPEQLSLLIYDQKVSQECQKVGDEEGQNKYLQTIVTTPTIPPNRLIEWVRTASIIPTKQYDSSSDFYKEVVSALQSVQDKIITTNMFDAFWDITYEGKKIISRKPKHETNIQRTVHGLLFDISISKNFFISPEYSLGGGDLDFLISGSLHDGRIVNVCVEFKNAHSKDLERGGSEQLPIYMKSKGTDLGIYVILDFRGEYFDLPKKTDIGVDVKVINAMKSRGIRNIRVLLLELGHKKSPSKT